MNFMGRIRLVIRQMVDVTYQLWMERVDKAVRREAGLSVYDLPDLPFRDWFDDEVTAAEAARMALAESGYYSGYDLP